MNDRRWFAIAGVVGVVVVVLVALRRGHGAPPLRSTLAAVSASREAPGDAVAPAGVETRAEARRARDAMRTEILAALRKRDAAASRAAPTPVPAPRASETAKPDSEEDPPRGHYEASYIQEHFRADMFPLLRQCYDSALSRRPALAGKLVLKFAIVGDQKVGGIVESAAFAEESDLKDTEMETCVRESLMTLTFEKPPEGGGLVNVTYPIAFSPGPDPEPETHGG